MADYIHHNLDRTLYSVTEDELDNIIEQSHPFSKDVCLVSFSVGISALLNAIANTDIDNFVLTFALFLNYAFGIIGTFLGVIFGIQWYRSQKKVKTTIKKIKSKPKMQLNPTTSNVGPLEEIKHDVRVQPTK